MNRKNNNLAAEGIDYTVIWLYAILVFIGILCIFMVEYKADTNWLATLLGGKANYSKQNQDADYCKNDFTNQIGGQTSPKWMFKAHVNLMFAQKYVKLFIH